MDLWCVNNTVSFSFFFLFYEGLRQTIFAASWSLCCTLSHLVEHFSANKTGKKLDSKADTQGHQKQRRWQTKCMWKYFLYMQKKKKEIETYWRHFLFSVCDVSVFTWLLLRNAIRFSTHLFKTLTLCICTYIKGRFFFVLHACMHAFAQCDLSNMCTNIHTH